MFLQKDFVYHFNFVVAVGDIDLWKHFEGMKAVTNGDDEKVYTIQLSD